jgi:hypothetical protein
MENILGRIDIAFYLLIIPGILFVVFALLSAYWGLAVGEHLRKNHYDLWVMTHTFSIKKRLEAQKQIQTIDDPVLQKLRLRHENTGKICLIAWLAGLFIMLGLIIILELTHWNK